MIVQMTINKGPMKLVTLGDLPKLGQVFTIAEHPEQVVVLSVERGVLGTRVNVTTR